MWLGYALLLCFNCVYEATTCVCAANIGTHARVAAAAAAARVERWQPGEEAAGGRGSHGGGGVGRGGEHCVEGPSLDEAVGGGIAGSRARGVRYAQIARGGGDVAAAAGDADELRLASQASGGGVFRSPPSALDSFGGGITALFVFISAAGYLVETVMQSSFQAVGGGLSLPSRVALHGLLLLVVGCGLGVAWCMLSCAGRCSGGGAGSRGGGGASRDGARGEGGGGDDALLSLPQHDSLERVLP